MTDPSSATVDKLTSPQAVDEGQSAQFQCTVNGSPRPKVTWMKGQDIIAVCDGNQHGTCRTLVDDSKYNVRWKDDRACMSDHSMGPTSGRWVSWLKVTKTQSPDDAIKYTCSVDNGRGQPQEQSVSLAING